jgi:hypothetical protein
MRPQSAREAKEWCEAQGANMGSRGFPSASGTSTTFEIPVDAGRRVALVADHLRHFGDRGDVLVWFNDWMVSPEGQRMHIFERFRASYGEQRPLVEMPAFLSSADEHEDLVSFVTLGVLFLWDVHVVASRAQPLLFYSHDEVGWIALRTSRPSMR